MADDLREEYVRNAVRAYLRDQNVKLWTSPYVQESGEINVDVIEALAEEYATKLKLEKRDCLEALIYLQDSAIKRMKEQEQFRAGGIATLHIRFSGFSAPQNESLPSTSKGVDVKNHSKSVAEIEISLSATGKELENAVSEISGKPSEQIKVVFNGRVIKKDVPLKDQGLKSSSKIMAIALSTESKDVENHLMYEKLCEKTRSAASTLSKESNEYASFELENQVGSSLKLDQKEKSALCLALALHERGRSSLKRGNHSLALLFFLEADREFGQCNSDILKSVDNVALLQLDIVWCYLCLRSISHIPDADRRLDICEVSLERSYGRNMERVAALKGSAGNEAALLMRLHLLQAIVAFHLHKIDRARELLNKAAVELQMLKVNTDDITQLVALGKSNEAGNLDAAVSKICEWQEERKQAREQNRKERAKERERKKLGKTADGSQYIEPECVSILCGMGYDRFLVISALKHSNNNMTQAVHLLQEQPHLLDVEKKSVHVSAEDITQIAAMGFDADIARLALRKHHGCIEDAVSDLLNNGGIIAVDPDKLPPEEDPSASNASSGQSSDERESDYESEKKRIKQMEAAYELENDIPTEEDDHLCITLEEEEMFLQEYKTLLKM
ncbi:NEDD8 ultimate buster 1 [Frankliniella fusca]|uniref:NEDD8 ultimate buster 1 n=1 Tax=Frankliniella fusca TaxID=407009 RepID=A0AAE1LUN9_9NEOP|nr:NEDD8 ultimate buster 1 [Frankliniella fusca]